MTTIEIKESRVAKLEKCLEETSRNLGYIMHVVHEMVEEEQEHQ